MTTTLLQIDIQWGEPQQNIMSAQLLMDAHPDSDLYVLPEMWNTGFATEPEGIAHAAEDNEALQWMVRTARQRQCALCGSLAVRLPDGSYRNRHYFADGRAGQLSYYDKHHLFTYGHEDLHYTAGTEQTIVCYGGWRFLLLTCYDLRFPCWARYSSRCTYDAIICVANWPDTRQSAWQILTRARAIENQCYLIGVNRVGCDAYSRYAGASAVIDAYGQTQGQCRLYQTDALTLKLDLTELRRRRQKFKVLDDRDELL